MEINASFYRPHCPATYARWAATSPPGFRFAVKVPKVITQEAKLVNTLSMLDDFLGADVSCIFNHTASGAALTNALCLRGLIDGAAA